MFDLLLLKFVCFCTMLKRAQVYVPLFACLCAAVSSKRCKRTVADGNAEGRFRIDRFSGQMSCDPLDREVKAAYNLSIEARDSGQPPRTSVMMLYIEVSACVRLTSVELADSTFQR